MKNILSFSVAVLLSAFLINCGPEEDVETEKKEVNYLSLFVGTWENYQYVIASCDNASYNEVQPCSPYCFKLTIESDGNFTLIDEDQFTESGTVSINESTFTFCDSNMECNDFNYSLEGSSIELSFKDVDDPSGCVNVLSFEHSKS